MKKKVQIKLKSYDHKLLDNSVNKIITQLSKSGAKVSGSIPLPTQISRYVVIRAPHKYKSSGEQFEIVTHKRLLTIDKITPEVEATLSRVSIPAGVLVELKM